MTFDQSAQLRWDALASAGCSGYPRLFHHVVRECEVVSGFLFATRRDTFDAAGGFDEAYAPFSYEEVDFCTAVRLDLGLRCYAVADVEHTHEFGVSAAWRPWRRVRFDGRSESVWSIDRRNRRRFLSKWADRAAPAR